MKIEINIADEIFNDLKDAAAFCDENYEDMLHKIVVKGIYVETVKTKILKKHTQNVHNSSSN